MSNGKNPLVLMMALTMPGAAHALGLGDIHVDSALNERLSAEIDIIGASAADLADMRASIANREIFLRYGADRPAFLESATFKVAHDSRGRPILAVRSSEAFMEPVVNFLVDLRWNKGDVVRQYTLLLDPPGFGSANRAVEVASAPVRSAPALPASPPAAVADARTPTATTARQIDPPNTRPARNTTELKVGARATLRGIAWRVGARTESGLKKTMLAIFRANPDAFEHNINRLHLGAVLTIPSYEQVAAISDSEAKREIHSQMVAWHSPPRPIAAKVPLIPPLEHPGAVHSASVVADAALDSRIHSLETELTVMKSALAGEQTRIDELQHQSAQAAEAQTREPQAALAQPVPSVSAADAASDAEQQPQEPATDSEPALVAEPASIATSAPAAVKTAQSAIIPTAAGLGLLAAALATLYRRLRRRGSSLAKRDKAVEDLPIEPTQTSPEATESGREMRNEDAISASDASRSEAGVDDATQPLLPLVTPTALPGYVEDATARISRLDSQDFTVKLRMDPAIDEAKVAVTRLDYNLVDLDLTAQHVQMPSVLNEHAVVKERRTNLADVLKLAIEREPDRHDLRMKLLELYYAAAATNRQGFLEAVQKFARERHHLQNGEWDKIAFMGRQIAAESPLFAEVAAEDDELADCA